MEYEIKGDSLPVLICKLKAGEEVLTQSGGMSWHTQGISVKTEGRGGLGKMFGRMLAGESAFQNIYQAHFDNQEIAFASSFPGAIMPINLSEKPNGLVIQKQAFLASDTTVTTDIFFQKKMGAGFFGGEGFIMLHLNGQGMAFLEVDGSVHKHTLASGEKLIVDTGHILAMDYTCRMSVERAGNVKSMLFGGEGLLNTVVHGPGDVYLQSMPLERLQSIISPIVHQST